MERVEETKSLTEGIRAIIDSYERRVETVGVLMRQTIQAVKNSQRQQVEIAEELRNILAKVESLRKKDFDKIMEEVWKRRREREKKVRTTLESFLKEEREMIDELRRLFDLEELMKIDDFMVLKERILNRQKEREKRVSQILRSFHLEQEELSTALRKLLSKGERVKIRDFKDMIRGLWAHWICKESSIGKALQELEMVDREVDTAWQGIIMSTEKNRI